MLQGCCAILEREDGKILLHLRCKKAWVYPNCWAFFGGGVEKGESPHAALRREMLEELDYPLTGHSLFSVAWHVKAGKRILDHTFYARWIEHPVRLREGVDARWFFPDEALALSNLPPHERGELNRLLTMRGMAQKTPLIF